ncbi:MAG: cobalamin-dependent protein [Planctomycetota bacterium]
MAISTPTPDPELIVERFLEVLVSGDRPAARRSVNALQTNGFTPKQIITDVFWPAHERIGSLYRADQLSLLSHRLATRLLRALADQTASQLVIPPASDRSVFACCGPDEHDELGAQIAVDILEAEGFPVTFAAGGVPTDEVLSHVHSTKPDILLLFCSAPADLPGIRAIIDDLREINATPNTQIAVGGGVFNRAEGLAEEIGADIWAANPLELIESLVEEPERRMFPEQRTVGRTRRKAA